MNARVDPTGPLRGELTPPADKSISHRAAILGAMSAGQVHVRNYLDAADTRSTLDAVAALGARVRRSGGDVVVGGVGLHGADARGRRIDVGNAGTLMRLLPGWLAAQDGRSVTLDGDASIRRRPVDRIAEPLRMMGATVEATDERFAPFTITGARLHAIAYELPVASAQIKSCVLLGALAAEGVTLVDEPTLSRDHTERMLAAAGIAIHREGRRVTLAGGEAPAPHDIVVPGDPSSAAFAVAAALLVPGSRVRLRDTGTNWTRTGFLRIAQRMGATIEGPLEERPREVGPVEPIGDLEVSAGPLTGTVVEADEVPLAIDELPLVALLGCFAEGETVVRGAGELRVKESDRIATVVEGLRALGGRIEATEDGFAVTGTGGLRGGTISSHGDHRLAMLGAVAGVASREGVEVVGMEAAEISYPDFLEDLAGLS